MTTHEPHAMTSPSCLDVLDAFHGFCSLQKRSQTLDGAVPLRVVGACLPFLEGNAYGFQVALSRPLTLARRFGGAWCIEALDAREALSRMHAAALPRLLAQGFLSRDGGAYRSLQRGPFWTERGALCLWTGLLLRPAEGVGLRISTCANRRSRLFSVAESFITDTTQLTPLILRIHPARGADRITLHHESATLGPLSTQTDWQRLSLSAAKEVGVAHTSFYDRAYFEEKEGRSTRRYKRQESSMEPPGPPARSASPRIVDAGACQVELVAGPIPHALFRNQLDFTARYDGLNVSLSYSRAALDEQAAALTSLWTSVYGESFVQEHRGALWYLTKYFTQHPPGEPHFFVKPWTFIVTPPGWSCLLEGISGADYDILRGVVSTDWFHATPAVFALRAGPGLVSVAKGTPLLKLFALPRWMLSGTFSMISFLDQL